MLKINLKSVLIVVVIILLSVQSKSIQTEGLFTIAITVCIILYIGYLNTSIREMKIKIEKLEKDIEEIRQYN